MEHEQIKLKSCYHQIIQAQTTLEESNVIIHQITDTQKEQGQPLHIVVEKLLNALAGKVMLVHFARIERQFLQQACLELYGLVPDFPIIDTLVIAKRQLDKRDVSYDPSDYVYQNYVINTNYQIIMGTMRLMMLLLQQNYYLHKSTANPPKADKIQLKDLIL